MLSLANAFSFNELIEFDQELVAQNATYVCELKLMVYSTVHYDQGLLTLGALGRG